MVRRLRSVLGNYCIDHRFSFDTGDLKKWVQNTHTDGISKAQSSLSESYNIFESRQRDTKIIELLSTALGPDNMKWIPVEKSLRSSRFENIMAFSIILSISHAFALNEFQHYAFRIISENLGWWWPKSCFPLETSTSFNPPIPANMLHIKRQTCCIFFGRAIEYPE